MKYLIISLILFTSCCPEPIREVEITPCNQNCGKLIDTRHFREEQKIRLMYVTECKDTITKIIELNQSQLGNDNGILFYVSTFKVGEKYCDYESNRI
jgi:hypothetical protein